MQVAPYKIERGHGSGSLTLLGELSGGQVPYHLLCFILKTYDVMLSHIMRMATHTFLNQK